jgi:hypothetical protein
LFTATSMTTGAVNDLNSQVNNNDISIFADKTDYTDISIRNRKFDYTAIGTSPNKSIAPLWVTSKDSDNAQGALIQRTTINSGTDNTIMTIESINGTDKATVKIKGNITNKQTIFDTGTNEARFTGRVKSNDKVIGAAGLGVGNSATASTLGTVVRKMEVFDSNGSSLGFIPIYNSIT